MTPEEYSKVKAFMKAANDLSGGLIKKYAQQIADETASTKTVKDTFTIKLNLLRYIESAIDLFDKNGEESLKSLQLAANLFSNLIAPYNVDDAHEIAYKIYNFVIHRHSIVADIDYDTAKDLSSAIIDNYYTP